MCLADWLRERVWSKSPKRQLQFAAACFVAGWALAAVGTGTNLGDKFLKLDRRLLAAGLVHPGGLWILADTGERVRY